MTERTFWIGFIAFLLIVAFGAIGILRYGGCWNVPRAEYRYCKRLGYEAFSAKADSAYWISRGLTP